MIIFQTDNLDREHANSRRAELHIAMSSHFVEADISHGRKKVGQMGRWLSWWRQPEVVWSLSDGLHRQIRGPVPLCCDDYQADGGEEERASFAIFRLVVGFT